MPILSILIPTYNRANKALRLLKNIEAEITTYNSSEKIEVLISNNASLDNTDEIVTNFSTDKFKIRYFCQPQNLGFDGNVIFLYKQAKTDYVWFMGDDDIILPGSLLDIMQGLNRHRPDVLLFSFKQPATSSTQTFNFSEPCKLITDCKMIAKLVIICPKLSILVLKKIELNPARAEELEPFFGNYFYFIDLAYTVLNASQNPNLCIISKALAVSDDEYIHITTPPNAFKELYKVLYHPFVLKHYPELPKEWQDKSYYGVIQYLFALKLGTLLLVENIINMQGIDKAIKDLEIKFTFLLKNPKAFCQIFLLKKNRVGAYLKIKPIVNFIRKVF